MKKLVTLLAAIAIFATAFSASEFSVPIKKADQVFLPINKDATISLKKFSEISIKNYEKLSGNDLNLFEKIQFKLVQKKIRKSIAPDGSITNEKLLDATSAVDSVNGFNAGWFILGLLLGLIGVLLSYLIKGDPDVKKNRQKWAWIGFGTWLVILLITAL